MTGAVAPPGACPGMAARSSPRQAPTCLASMSKASWPYGEGVEAVAVDSRDEGACPYPAQRGGRSAAAAADVVTVHRLGQRDVAAGVESPGELVGMVVKIGLDGVPAPAPWG